MAGALTEAILNKFSKPNLGILGSQIVKLSTEVKDLLANSKKLDADVAFVRNVNSKLTGRFAATECQIREDAKYWRWGRLKMVGIPTTTTENVLEQSVCDTFQKIGVDLSDREIQVSHCLKDNDQTFVQFINKKDFLQILRVKR